ncbi:MAG: SPFH domain-containing protein [bacterium]|nr:SPFH domain-containing protein [bacterium]MDZ4284250.1 SPFH domain-containing protein [Patescibacteria group bacterium]
MAIGYGVAIAIVFLLWLIVGTVKIDPSVLGLKEWQPWLAALEFLAGYTLLSWRIVGEEQIGAKILLGYRIQDLSAGLAFVPLLICRLRTETSQTIQMEFPAEPENIWYEATAPPDAEKRPPIRIPSGGSSATTVTNPLDRGITLEVTYFVRLRILSLCQFLEVTGSQESAFKQIEDTVNPIIVQAFAGRSPQQILLDFPIINGEVQTAVQQLVAASLPGQPDRRAWGVAIESVALKAPDLTKRVNQARADASAAGFTAQQSIELARGTSEASRLTETVAAAMRQLFLENEGAGLSSQFTALMQALNVTDPAHALALLERVQGVEALKKAGDVTIIGGGSGGVANLYGLVQSLAQSVQQPQAGTTSSAAPAAPASPEPPTPAATPPQQP